MKHIWAVIANAIVISYYVVVMKLTGYIYLSLVALFIVLTWINYSIFKKPI